MRIWFLHRERAVDAPQPEPEPFVEPDPGPGPTREREPLLAVATSSPPELEPAPEPEPEPLPPVVPLVLRDQTPRAWNLWELERLAGEPNAGAAPEERRLLLLHLRQFADPAGELPVEFDPLVREAFGAELAALPR